jgi:hypothetical protein
MGLQIAMVVVQKQLHQRVEQVHDYHHDKHSLLECLWIRVSNSSSYLFETPCIVHMFINNKVDASMVDMEPKNKG